VAFRLLTGGLQPDHSAISEFRRVHLEALKTLFVQVLQLCQKAGLLKMGHVALDGTKIQANASKHKAMSHERIMKAEKELGSEIQKLLEEAERVDHQEDERYGKDKRGDERGVVADLHHPQPAQALQGAQGPDPGVRGLAHRLSPELPLGGQTQPQFALRVCLASVLADPAGARCTARYGRPHWPNSIPA